MARPDRRRMKMRAILERDRRRGVAPALSAQPSPTPPPPARHPTPVPARTPESATATRLAAKRQEVAALHAQVTSELTPLQAKRGKIPTPKVVPSIGRVDERAVAGRSEFPPPGRAAGAIYGAVRGLMGQPSRQTRISLEAGRPERALRHETAHHVLGAQGILRAEHHPIIRAATPHAGPGVSFPLLERAARAHVTPSVSAVRELQRGRERFRRRTIRRGLR